ncbi:myb-related protein 3R-1 [Artemisia annua]|uniref:Myb-related protein 3R-1 n=1 Tax=Artemisia annua TaxID=35608 RepID=A0A2U1P2R3_ARTAN|nr:myb-related protein 3R-1 [Artemisia annua]
MEGDSTAVSDGLRGRRIIRRDLNGRTTGPIRRSTKGQWTEEEDETLKSAVKKFGAKNWKEVAKCFEGRKDAQCSHRWHKVLNPKVVKGPWTKEEDEDLVRLVKIYGTKNWSTIAKYLPGHIGKQCRERWHNNLNPDINKEPWTKDEEMMLIIKHKAYGNKWAELTKFLPRRTDNAIKNHWNNSLSKKLDTYMESGLLETFQGLPSVVNESTPTTSSRYEEDQPVDMLEALLADDMIQPAGDLQWLSQLFTSENDFPDMTPPLDGSSDPLLYQQSYCSESMPSQLPSCQVQQPHGVLVEHASVENSGIFGETPLKNSLESPSQWKYPSPPFVLGPPIDTDITLADVEGYDALGLMKQPSEQIAPEEIYANAREVLGGETPDSLLKKRLLQKSESSRQDSNILIQDLQESDVFNVTKYDPYSVARCMGVLNGMVNGALMTKDSPLLYLAMDFFEDAVKRELFMTIRDDSARLKWLQHKQDQGN